MIVTPVAQRRQVVFEGLPGVGKTTTCVSVAFLTAKVYGSDPRFIILLNGRPLVERASELILSSTITGKSTNESYLRCLYDPEVNHKYAIDWATFGFSFVAEDLEFQEKYPIKPEVSDKIVINFCETNGATTAGLYMRANFLNSCADKDMQWNQGFSAAQSRLVDLIRSACLKDTYYDIVYLKGSPEICHEKVVRRGREYEANNFSLDYMKKLSDMYEQFIYGGDDLDEGVIPISAFYLKEGQMHMDVVETDPYYVKPEEQEAGKSHLAQANALAKRVMDFVICTLIKSVDRKPKRQHRRHPQQPIGQVPR